MTRNQWIAQIAAAQPQELPVIIRTMMAAGSSVGTEVLMDIVQMARGTEFGKKHGFDEINSIEDFRARVPITEFSDYSEAIERLKKGEADILFPGPAHSFLASSGSTGVPKYVPESALGYQVKAAVGGIRTVEMLRMAPEVMAEDATILPIVNPAEYEKTEGGIPVGSASGQAAESASMASKFVLPPALLKATGIAQPDMDYLTILFALADRNMTALICNNLAHFHILLERLYGQWEDIVGDMANGKISVDIDEDVRSALVNALRGRTERAEELRALFAANARPSVEQLWPRLTSVGCWLSASVGRVAEDVKTDFPPTTKYMDWGYGASEGKFNIPLTINSAAGVPALFGYFFEYLPIGADEPLLWEETQAGGIYELIVTSYSGLYRYNIHDAVRVDIASDGFKTIEFVGKTAECIDTPKGPFHSFELTAMIEDYERANDVFIRFYQLTQVESGVVVDVEAVCEHFDRADFEAYLRKRLAQEKSLALTKIEWHADGYRDSLFVRALKPGKTVNQTKLAIFHNRP